MKQLSLAARAAGHSVSRAILEDKIETFKAELSAHHPVETSAGHPKASEDLLALQAGLLVHLQWVAEVLSADFMVVALGVVALGVEAFMAVASPAAVGSYCVFWRE